MPPKIKITRDMILNAAFDIARNEGADRISARAVAERLGCSTQPVMSHFATVADLKQAVYGKADQFHTAALLDFAEGGDPLLRIGLNYIRFAAREQRLFRFLFQSNQFAGTTLADLLNAPELEPLFSAAGGAMGTDPARAREFFSQLFLFAHGYAAMLANNAMEYNEADAARRLELAYAGAVLAAKEDMV